MAIVRVQEWGPKLVAGRLQTRPAEPLGIAPEIKPRWPLARIGAVETLCGKGFSRPGGPEETLQLAKPLGLTREARLTLLGGGLGGPARTIAGTYGSRVTSFEADPDLNVEAQRRAAAAPDATTSRIVFQGWDRIAPNFHPKTASHIMAVEALRGAPAGPVLRSLSGAVLLDGHFVLTELVADTPPDRDDREFAAWCRLDQREPLVPSASELNKILEQCRFSVRVVEDMSEWHTAITLAAWRGAVRLLENGERPSAAAAASLVNEAELWMLRLRLMRRFGFKLMRWHAIAF